MKTRTFETSPQVYARIAALLYLVVIAAGIFVVTPVMDGVSMPGTTPSATAPV